MDINDQVALSLSSQLSLVLIGFCLSFITQILYDLYKELFDNVIKDGTTRFYSKVAIWTIIVGILFYSMSTMMLQYVHNTKKSLIDTTNHISNFTGTLNQ